MKIIGLFSCCFIYWNAFSQKDTASIFNDSSNMVVNGFYANKKWKDVPAAIALVSSQQLQSISTQTLLPALNAVPGIKMEERSPASYRLAIRGSSLRSPFGVRNVKVYLNDMPLTDGGGNTYLNLVALNTIDAAEIMKGPSSGIYGAGTGGVLMLKNNLACVDKKINNFFYTVIGGSYGLLQQNAGWQSLGRKVSSQVLVSQQQSNGYRQQSNSVKDVVHWNLLLKWKQQQLRFQSFYTDLFYGTPGGLTLAQMNTNPQLARSATSTLPGAIQQNASIRNKTFFSGLTHEWKPSNNYSYTNSVGYFQTNFLNPSINNYEERKEQNIFLRSRLQYYHKNFRLINGAEWLHNNSLIDDYGNKNGVKDTVQFKDNVKANQWFVFAQAQISFHHFFIQAGVSVNQQLFSYQRLTDTIQKKISNANSNIVAAPRLTINYSINDDISLYVIISKGFSPPSLAEIHPSDGLFHSELQAEFGWNNEFGIKGFLLKRRLSFDVAAYYFYLQNAIVRRNNTIGQEYFINAGSVLQKGFEAWLQYQFLFNATSFIHQLKAFSSYSYQPYSFSNYQQSGVDYSNHAVTGVPKNTMVIGVTIQSKNHFLFSVQFNNTASIPLNDANDEFAKKYHLLQAKISKDFHFKNYALSIYVSGDNLLNEQYSLGNDINAAGRRYYNPAATINYASGIYFKFN
jgi:iron complex outermembrane receptor protein